MMILQENIVIDGDTALVVVADRHDWNVAPDARCDNCDGTGQVGDGTVAVTCVVCDGTGRVSDAVNAPLDSLAAQIAELSLRIEELESRMQSLRPPAGTPTSTVEAPRMQSHPAGGPIEWVDLATAEASDKPVWLHFRRRTGCAACDAQEENIFSKPRVAAASRQWACVRVNEVDPLVDRFRVRVWPSEVFVTAEGVSRLAGSGGLGVDEFLSYLEDVK